MATSKNKLRPTSPNHNGTLLPSKQRAAQGNLPQNKKAARHYHVQWRPGLPPGPRRRGTTQYWITYVEYDNDRIVGSRAMPRRQAKKKIDRATALANKKRLGRSCGSKASRFPRGKSVSVA